MPSQSPCSIPIHLTVTIMIQGLVGWGQARATMWRATTSCLSCTFSACRHYLYSLNDTQMYRLTNCPLLVSNGDQMAFLNASRSSYKKLVGATTVLQATVDEAAPVIAHAYCHPSYNGSLTLTIVNPTSSSATVDLRSNGRLLSGPAQQRTAWVFTAPAGNLSSSFPVLNGRQPLRIEADGSLPPMEGAEAFDDDGTFAVPALSWSFHVVASDLPACQHAMQPL